MTTSDLPLLRVRIHHEHDIVAARRRARQIAAALGFDAQDQTRIATAVSELARNAYQYAGGGTVDYSVGGQLSPQVLIIRVEDHGTGIAQLDAVLSGTYHRSSTGMGLGLLGARRLMDGLEVQSGAGGTRITIKKLCPRRSPLLTPPQIASLAGSLLAEAPAGPLEEVQQQNQELVRTLEELQARQEDLQRVNRELEDTNRGVVALYAELDERADHLRRADELKTRFLSNMTHEFRTPVNAILALTNLLMERLGGASNEKDELYYIRRSAQQLSEIVDDLLDIAKVEAGKIEVRPTTFDVAGLFGALRGMLRPLLVNQSVSLVFDEPDDLSFIYSDESKISQILRNFISNALKYTERGEVRVSARTTPQGDAVEFLVSDTGIGIPEADLARVFDEFVQIENPLQHRVKGTGLGLPLSKRLAELLGGKIDVKSQLGVGSTFSLTVPFAYRTRIASALPLVDADRRPVLVIEDAEEDLFLYQRALSGTRFQVVPVGTAEAAESALVALRPAAVVLDIRLQREDSWDLLTRLKRDERTASVPVIIVSTVDDRQKGLLLGADAYSVKPIDTRWLLETLDRLVPPASSVRVLTVDDEEAHRFIVRELLTGTSYQVAEAATGLEALRLIRELPPDVVLLDLRLTDMNGIEMAEQLREDPGTSRVPIVLITSHALSPDERRRLGEQHEVLSKYALTREGLRDAIERAVRTARFAETRA